MTSQRIFMAEGLGRGTAFLIEKHRGGRKGHAALHGIADIGEGRIRNKGFLRRICKHEGKVRPCGMTADCHAGGIKLQLLCVQHEIAHSVHGIGHDHIQHGFCDKTVFDAGHGIACLQRHIRYRLDEPEDIFLYALCPAASRDAHQQGELFVWGNLRRPQQQRKSAAADCLENKGLFLHDRDPFVV